MLQDFVDKTEGRSGWKPEGAGEREEASRPTGAAHQLKQRERGAAFSLRGARRTGP